MDFKFILFTFKFEPHPIFILYGKDLFLFPEFRFPGYFLFSDGYAVRRFLAVKYQSGSINSKGFRIVFGQFFQVGEFYQDFIYGIM